MEENNTPESIYSFQSKSGNESAALYGEFNADNLTVTDAELIIQRVDPRYIFTYLVSGTITEIDIYARQLINEIQN
jgi:hypothetical protein|tara:strand:+ start:1071 stop:1298 length:228 start_codon:yes stop_codon:yes gene_type:complete